MKLIKPLVILFLTFFVSCHLCLSQGISVASFALDEMDLTANMPGTTAYDQNGEKCALIKINTTQVGFTFDVGYLGVSKVEEKPAQIWLYVPHGVRQISIYHKVLGSLDSWTFPCNIESAKTYHMRLTTAEVQTVVKKTTYMDFLVVNVTPKDAVVYINDEMWDNENGVAVKLVEYGTYEYRVQAESYHTAEGQVIVDNSKKEITVKLKPAFGYLTLQKGPDMEGAFIVIDNRRIAATEITKFQLPSGTHTINITKKFWRPIKKTFEIYDEKETTLSILPEANFTLLSVKADPETEIFINDKSMGSGSWSGKLESGAYRITGKKWHHTSVNKEIVVKGIQDSQIITLDSPVPIVGSASITSTPVGCRVEIDGEEVGTTPLFLQDKVIEGTHTVRFTKKGYYPVEKEIVIKENEITELKADLFNTARVVLKLTPSNCYIRMKIDGKDDGGSGKCERFLTLGEHHIEVAETDRFEAFSMNCNIRDDRDIDIVLTEKKSYIREKELALKAAEKKRIEQEMEAERHRKEAEKALKRAERAALNHQGYPFGVGWNMLSVTTGSRGLGITSDLFFHLGTVRNVVTTDFGAGVNGVVYEGADSFSETAIPVFLRFEFNLARGAAVRGRGSVYPYIGIEGRRNFAIEGESSWSFPVRFGATFFNSMKLELMYEPYIFPGGDFLGQFGGSLIFVIERRK